MNAEMQTTVAKLKRLSEALSTRDQANYYLSQINVDSYINSKCVRPLQLEEKKQPSLVAAFVFLAAAIVFAFGALLCLVLYVLSVFPSGTTATIVFSALALVFLLIGFIVFRALKSTQEAVAKQNKETTEFNTVEYPKLLSSYNDQVIAARQEFDDLKTKLIEKRNWAESVIAEEGDIVSSKFYPDIDRIVDVIEDRRADSLKEAINRMLDDKQQEAMLMLQIDQNKKLEAQNRKLDRQSAQLQGISMAALEAAVAAQTSAYNSAETAKNTESIANQLGRK